MRSKRTTTMTIKTTKNNDDDNNNDNNNIYQLADVMPVVDAAVLDEATEQQR